MALSPEERQRIYEEEKARLEIREQLQPAAPVKKKRRFGALTVIFLVILVWALWSAISSVNSPTASGPAASTAPAPEPLQVVDFDWKTGQFGNRLLVGTVKNNSSKTYNYAQIQFNLYDKSGAVVGSTLANVNNLGPNATWKFEAAVLQDSATKATVEKISGF